MALPKLEGLITVPSGGWTVSVTETTPNAGPVSVTVATAGDYYLTSTTSLLTTVAAALTANGTLGGTYSASVNDADPTGTGKVTLSATGVTSFAITWTSTTLRDALGFTGNITGAATYTSQSSSPYIWLPNTPRAPGRVPDGHQGEPVTDGTVTGSPTGVTTALAYATRYEDTMEWRQLLGSKTWNATNWESVTNESLYAFWTATIAMGQPIRYHRDRADDTTYVTYRHLGIGRLGVVPAIPTFTGGPTSLWNWGPFPVVKLV